MLTNARLLNPVSSSGERGGNGGNLREETGKGASLSEDHQAEGDSTRKRKSGRGRVGLLFAKPQYLGCVQESDSHLRRWWHGDEKTRKLVLHQAFEEVRKRELTQRTVSWIGLEWKGKSC